MRKIDKREKAAMEALRDIGYTCKEISETLNIPESTVYYYVGEEGYFKNKQNKHYGNESNENRGGS